MREIQSKDTEVFDVDGLFKVGIFPYPSEPEFSFIKLDLARKDAIAVLIEGTESVADVDAAVTSNHALSIGMRTRDCAPICISDGKVLGIAHVGWPGYALGLVEKFLPYFDQNNLHVYVGPFLNEFEIKKDGCYEKLMEHPGTEPFIREKDGKIIFYFKEALAALLPEDTLWDTRTTGNDPTLPSYRGNKDSVGFLTTISFS